MFFKEIETDRLFLRNISAKDREFIYAQFSNDKVTRYLFDAEPLTDIKDVDEIIDFYLKPEPREQHRWILVRKGDGTKIGTCGFHLWDKTADCCEIGYDLHPDFWGNGYMGEAVRDALGFARENMGIKCVNACIYVDNLSSIKFAEKLGFAFYGKTKDYIFRGQKYSHKILTLKIQEGLQWEKL